LYDALRWWISEGVANIAFRVADVQRLLFARYERSARCSVFIAAHAQANDAIRRRVEGEHRNDLAAPAGI